MKTLISSLQFVFRGEEQADADLTELTEASEPEAGSSQGKSVCMSIVTGNLVS